jgi:hypothetical protein
MKQTLFNLTGFLILILLTINGCKKEDTTPLVVISAGKQITSFKIVTPAATGIIDTTNKTISISVPIGTDLTNLSTDITLAADHTISPSSGTAQNFTNPVVYTVTRPDNTTTAWTVTVTTPGVAVDQDITSSVTWTSDKVYFVIGDRYIDNNSVLTIQPGTVIKFEAGASLSFGYSSNATLIALGTAEHPITFTSSALAPSAGAWKGLYFESNTLNNTTLAYCNIQYAGSYAAHGALNMFGCDISVNNCTINNSGSYGVYSSYSNNHGGFVAFNNNTISNTANYGIVIDAQKLSSIGTGNQFMNIKGIFVDGSFNNNTAQIWKNLSFPYIIDHELDIDGNLTIEAGTTFKFEASGWIVVGYYSSTTFIAEGNSTSPITFTSNAASPAAGAWQSITFDTHTLSNSKMNYCIVDYAGSNTDHGAVNLYGTTKIAFNNNIIRNCGSYGIEANSYEEPGFVSFTNNTINSCANHVIIISSKHLPDLGTPNTLEAAAGKGIEVTGHANYTTAVTWKKQTADFYVSGECDLDGNITFEAGSKFLFVDDGFFYFGYYSTTILTAVGTSTNKITFTTAASSPAAGAWRGLVFDVNIASNSALTYCAFHYTGYADAAAIVAWAPLAVNNTTIDNYSSPNAAEYRGTMPTGTGNNFSWVAF